jgi:hypothetical protein
MTEMYCPQCGRELDLDAGEVRFCRYCGFSLSDTKEALQGYSGQKRTGFLIVILSYTLLLIVALLMHGGYVSLDRTRWAYWLFLILIVLSFSFFFAATLSAVWPARFQSKAKRRDKETLETHGDSPGALRSAEGHGTSLLTPPSVPVTDSSNQERRAKAEVPRSIIENTTERLNDRSHSG